jgi:endonuclease VIII
VTDEEALAVIADARPRMFAATERTRPAPNERRIYDRAGQPCPRCGTAIKARGQGDDNRTTFWCPGCQR